VLNKEDVSSDDGATDVSAVTATRPRAGALTLSVLATPLNLSVLRALADRPMRLAELRKATGLPAQTTLRGHLASLTEIGVLLKRPTERMPYAVENELTPMGRDLLGVANRLEAWLALAPDGPIPLGGGAARGAVKALVDGWGSTTIRALVLRPRSLTELDSLLPALSYPALERRLASMRMAGLVEPQPSRGAGTPYSVTDWGRRGIVPLAAASHCERLYMRTDTDPLSQDDIETAFLLATPLVGLPAAAAGQCQLEVEESPRDVRRPVGVQVTVERGRVVSCVSRLEPAPGAYAVGSANKWFHALNEGSIERLRFGGGRDLAEGLVLGLHTALSEAGPQDLASIPAARRSSTPAAFSPTKGTRTS
jgi:DNA-binding HxlR family transcriptional regulator